MMALGALFVALGIALLLLLPDDASVHYYGSLHYNSRMLVGLGCLCLFMGLIVIRGTPAIEAPHR